MKRPIRPQTCCRRPNLRVAMKCPKAMVASMECGGLPPLSDCGGSPPRFEMDYFEDRRALIDRRLASIAGALPAPKPLLDPIARALRSSGKRVRGILTIAAGEAAGAKAE